MRARLPALVASQLRSLLAKQLASDSSDSSTDSMSSEDSEDDMILLLSMYHHHWRVRHNPPPVSFQDPSIDEPWNHFSSTYFQDLCRFEPQDFHRIVELLHIEDGIVTPERCTASKSFCIFLLLRRWSIPDRWKDISSQLRIGRSKLEALYKETLRRIVDKYKKLITRIDQLRVMPRLEIFASAIADIEGLVEDVGCFADGKPVPTCKPGDCDNPYDMQRAFYNGHYKSHGLKAQNVICSSSCWLCSWQVISTDQFSATVTLHMPTAKMCPDHPKELQGPESSVKLTGACERLAVQSRIRSRNMSLCSHSWISRRRIVSTARHS